MRLKIRDQIEKITEANSVEDVWKLHTDTMASYGFDRLLYGFTHFRQGKSIGDRSELLVLTNHEPEYVDALFLNRRMIQGPMAQWCMENVGCCSWSVIRDLQLAGGLSDEELEVVAFNMKMNVTAGYSISFQSQSNRFRAAIALVGKPGLSQDEIDRDWTVYGEDIYLMNKVMHLQLQTLPRENARPLTKRQQEVLDWVGDGKSVSDIAVLLELTPATVEKHLRLAREALNSETTAQAVLKRSFQNQVFTLT